MSKFETLKLVSVSHNYIDNNINNTILNCIFYLILISQGNPCEYFGNLQTFFILLQRLLINYLFINP